MFRRPVVRETTTERKRERERERERERDADEAKNKEVMRRPVAVGTRCV